MSSWKVWYQPTTKFGRRYHSGTLTVEPGQVHFAGKQHDFTISSARSVQPKSVGMTTWVHVVYDEGGEPRDAMFVDRRMLGWSGMLGGNNRLRVELQEALAESR